jgi:hypothetical protein
MKKIFAIFNFGRLSFAAFISRARSVQHALSQPLFMTIVPTPAEVSLVIDNLENLWSVTNLRNYQHKAERDRVRADLELLLMQQIFSVNNLAAGNPDVLRQSGFDLNKQPTAKPLPGTPIIKGVASTGDEGAIEFSFIRPKDASFYEVEVLNPSSEVVHQCIVTRTKLIIQNLPLGIQLRVRVRAQNATGKGVWTMPYPFMISVMEGVYGVYVFTTAKKNNNRSSSEDASVA